jgi:hypothetical protein
VSGFVSGNTDGLGNLTPVVNALQEMTRASYLTQQTLAGLSLNTNTLPSYTVAGLPVGASAGRMAYASNGRNPGEGAGAGSGVLVIASSTGVWRSAWSGVLVTS